MSFEEELKKGNFLIPQCNKCKKIVWPPSDFCDKCFGKVGLNEKQENGKVVTFSKHNNDYFCVVEFKENIKIIAKSEKQPKKDQIVEVTRCGIKNNDYFFEIK